MKRLPRWVIACWSAGAAATLASAHTAPPPAVAAPGSTLREADRGVAAAAYRIAVAGAPLCPERHPVTGMLFHHLAEYRPGDRPLMIQRYRLDRGPGVLTVLDGSPAARAGLRAGDVLLAVNGAPLPAGAAFLRSKDWRKLAEGAEGQLEAALKQGPATVRIVREGRESDLRLDSVPGCLGRVRLARSDQMNAFATGTTVIMTTRLLGFLRSEDELAVVLAHELSHNILHHPDRLDEQGVPKSGFFRAFGKNAARVWKTEEEADRFAIGLMWRAGYNVEAAIPFWRRFLGKYDALPQVFRTHPSLPVRERITREAIDALPRPRPTSGR
ncbi:MAG TPA: M48 family metallopeptidase [Allosphingosinicella sp.]|jgi:hypothetical protein